MSSTYSLYRDLSCPTAVDTACTAHFTHQQHSNLIVVKQALLEVYIIQTINPQHQAITSAIGIQPQTGPESPSLTRVGQFKLFGKIGSIGVVRLPGYSRDSLLVTFADCKLSLLHYDASTADLITLDTGLYEQMRDTLPMEGLPMLGLHVPLIKIDPLQRCAILLAYNRYLLIFPFNSDQTESNIHIEKDDHAVNPYYYSTSHNILQPYTIPLASLNITRIIDFIFLPGYYSPTLLLLHETPSTWEGRYAVNRHTAQLLTVTLSLNTASFSLIGPTAVPLPHDTHTLLALPAPHYGCLIFSAHLIFHWHNQHIEYVLSTNQYGDTDRRYHAEPSGVVADIQTTSVKVLSATATSATAMINTLPSSLIQVLVALTDGQLLLLSVEQSGAAVNRMTLMKLCSSAIVSSISLLPSSSSSSSFLVFLSSRLGPSLLVEMRERSESEMAADRLEAERLADEQFKTRQEREKEREKLLRTDMFGGPAASTLSSSSSLQAEEEHLDTSATELINDPDQTSDELFDDIFGLSLTINSKEKEAAMKAQRQRVQQQTSRMYEMTIRDVLINVAPSVDFMVIPKIVPADNEDNQAGNEKSKSKVLELLSLSGQGQQGMISIQSEGVVPNISTTFPLDQRCTGCWTVHSMEPKTRGKPNKRKRQESSESIMNDISPYHSYLFISTPTSTIHLQTQQEVTQVDSSVTLLLTDVSSLLIGNVHGGYGIVQVWSRGVRLVWRGEKVIDQLIDQLGLLDDEISPHIKDEMKDENGQMKQSMEDIADIGGDHQQELKITKASLCDPYLSLLLNDGSLRIISVMESEQKDVASESNEPVQLHVLHPPLSTLPHNDRMSISAVSLYRDPGVTDIFKEKFNSIPSSATKDEEMTDAEFQSLKEDKQTEQKEVAEEVDELEMMLLAGGQADQANGDSSDNQKVEASVSDHKNVAEQIANIVEPIYVCVVCRGHYLEIYSLPSFTLLFHVSRFTAGNKLLTDTTVNDSMTPENNQSHSINDGLLPYVTDVTLHQLGSVSSSTPILLAFTSKHDLLIYHLFDYILASSVSSLRFKRIHHNIITRPPPVKIGRSSSSNANVVTDWLYGDRLVSFSSLSGRSGVLIGGWKPCILFDERANVRLHELVLNAGEQHDDTEKVYQDNLSVLQLTQLEDTETSKARKQRLKPGVACNTLFHNINCDHGFIYIDIAGYLHIAELPAVPPLPSFSSSAASSSTSISTLINHDSLYCTHYDHTLPIRILPLHSTPRFITYHPPTSSFSLILGHRKPLVSMEEVTPRSLPLMEDGFELLLLSSTTFTVIGRFDDFDDHEVVLSLATVILQGKMYIAVGTANQTGEEISVRGRILLLDAYYAMGYTGISASAAAASGEEETNRSTRLLKLRAFAQAEKGPVTCISYVGDLLLLGVGSRVMLYEYDGKALIGRAFLEVQYYIAAVKVIKSYLLIADIYQSVQFAVWDPIVKQIIILGRYQDDLEVTAVDYILDGKHLNLIVADMRSNLTTFRYQPKLLAPPPPMPAAITATSTLPISVFFAQLNSIKMQPKGDFHCGGVITRMEKVKMKGARGAGSSSNSSMNMTQIAAVPHVSSTLSGLSGSKHFLPASPPPRSAREREAQLQQPLPDKPPDQLNNHQTGIVVTPLRSMLLLSALDGNYAVYHPIDDITYRRLNLLHAQLISHYQPYAALNPRAWRHVSKPITATHYIAKRGTVDGSMVWLYLSLDVDTQTDIAKIIGMQIDQIIEILAQIEWQTALH